MAFEKMTDNMNIISSLGDEPNEDNGLSASKLKEKFDTAGLLAKEAINKLISALGASTAAGNIGFASSTQVPADNVQDAIDNVQGQLAGVSQGAVANGSITSEKLADGAVTVDKVAPEIARVIDVSDSFNFGSATLSENVTSAYVDTYQFKYAPLLGVIFYKIVCHVYANGEGTVIFPVNGSFRAADNKWGFAANVFTYAQDYITARYLAPLSQAISTSGELDLAFGADVSTNFIIVSGWFFTDGAEVA